MGSYGRYSGLLSYLCYGVLFLAVMACATFERLRTWTRSVLVAAGAVTTYGLLQAAGWRPFDFHENGLPGAFSTMGQVNFAGAWIGAVSGLTLVVALSTSETRVWRVYAALLLPAALAYAVVTTSSQALVVAMISLGWSTAVFAKANHRARAGIRAHRTAAFVAGASLTAAVALAGWGLRGHLLAAMDQSLVERPAFWSTALAIWSDHPVAGSGLDTFGQFFLAYRPVSHALIPGAGTADAPHSVPLAMLSNGGLLLFLGYAAFVALVGVSLVRGAVRSDDDDRRVLAAWGGVWLGYQAQSLVSFDVPPLAVLHFVSGGIIVAFATCPAWKSLGMSRRRPRIAFSGARGRMPRSTLAAYGAITGVAVLTAWLALYPMRADLTAASAAPLTAVGRQSEALARFERAARLNPSEDTYPMLAARSLLASGNASAALDRVTEAAQRAPGEVAYPVFAARIAHELGRESQAADWYREAIERDPHAMDVLTEAAGFFLSQGHPKVAETYVQTALAVDPTSPAARELMREIEG